MTGFRRLIAHQRWLAAWLIAAALAVRVLVPAGYMPDRAGGARLVICPGQAAPVVKVAPMPAMDHHGHGDHRDHGGGHEGADASCPFAGLAMPTIAAADPSPALATATAPMASTPVRPADARAPPRLAYAQPPLRGPPSVG